MKPTILLTLIASFFCQCAIGANTNEVIVFEKMIQGRRLEVIKSFSTNLNFTPPSVKTWTNEPGNIWMESSSPQVLGTNHYSVQEADGNTVVQQWPNVFQKLCYPSEPGITFDDVLFLETNSVVFIYRECVRRLSLFESAVVSKVQLPAFSNDAPIQKDIVVWAPPATNIVTNELRGFRLLGVSSNDVLTVEAKVRSIGGRKLVTTFLTNEVNFK